MTRLRKACVAVAGSVVLLSGWGTSGGDGFDFTTSHGAFTITPDPPGGLSTICRSDGGKDCTAIPATPDSTQAGISVPGGQLLFLGLSNEKLLEGDAVTVRGLSPAEQDRVDIGWVTPPAFGYPLAVIFVPDGRPDYCVEVTRREGVDRRGGVNLVGVAVENTGNMNPTTCR